MDIQRLYYILHICTGYLLRHYVSTAQTCIQWALNWCRFCYCCLWNKVSELLCDKVICWETIREKLMTAYYDCDTSKIDTVCVSGQQGAVFPFRYLRSCSTNCLNRRDSTEHGLNSSNPTSALNVPTLKSMRHLFIMHFVYMFFRPVIWIFLHGCKRVCVCVSAG